MEQLHSKWVDLHEIWYLSIFKKSVEEIQVSLKYDNNDGYFTWWPIYIFDWNVSGKTCRENQNKLFMLKNFFFSKIVPFIITRKTSIEPIRPQMTWHLHFACWVPKATKPIPEFVKYIAFLRQQWFRERPSVLRYAHIAYLVSFNLHGRDSSDY